MWSKTPDPTPVGAYRRRLAATAMHIAAWTLALAGCSDTSPATEVNPCLAANHCVINDDGKADCEAGHTWEDADDPLNLTCVPVPEAADAGADVAPTVQVAGPRPFDCGDGECATPWESAANCAVDCAHWRPVCGDGSCDKGETCSDCADDCGVCKAVDAGTDTAGPKCGDYICSPGENCSTCPGDCGNCKDGGGGGPGSCQGQCGKYNAAWPCQCDSGCQQFKDCCPDIGQVCP